MDIKKFIEQLQNQPYEKRVRILWVSSFIAILVVGVTWIGLSAIQSKINEKENKSQIFSEIEKNLEVAKIKFDKLGEDLQQQISQLQIPDDPQIITLVNYTLSINKDKLVIEFIANNPSLDILNFLQDNYQNVKLTSGLTKYIPEQILTKEPENPYPKKILSNESIYGYMIFEAPLDPELSLDVTNMYFDNLPDNRFSDNLKFNLNTQVTTSSTNRLPRE
ncbi:MAG: hypothetical protein COT91_02355 [Candidatus Doudnabacteria bacterium CG10_big_fil_rev_8_21_14_0_10_41_10]|uniref:Uncharacterized protein n=1 Tax=Candidatus Doudnabacteria bacterium CG10_big_fil_rev_8_21_14_0_10_41_10 TaxID=1974551 RepID=A0A2H0VDS7_9BACT|nr:MAG: hypothetical protein COT91_02355 [Candidatus Doudnabacteria bacterium CG10_big_fil_rev_8_21_14_0_10_41_10]